MWRPPRSLILAIKKPLKSEHRLHWIGFLGYLCSFLGLVAEILVFKATGLLLLSTYHGVSCMLLIKQIRS